MFGDGAGQAFREFKAIWDPDWTDEPGQGVRPLSARHQPADRRRLPPARAVETYFTFPDDGGTFAAAAERCFGVGACRTQEGGVMCPSYLATSEEKHSTRGRARLLFEMMQRRPIKDGWRSEEVKEALDLCLSCKGCKNECPVHVDMATYKAEFLSHYYERRPRPRARIRARPDHAGRGRLAAPRPRERRSRAPRRIGETLAGIAPQRDAAPASPTRRSRAGLRARGAQPAAGRRVILWPDTFKTTSSPMSPKRPSRCSRRAGSRSSPARPLCCGRPLYDFGMLELAAAPLAQILDGCGRRSAPGSPSSASSRAACAVFRDELMNMLPARRGRQATLQTDVLVRRVSLTSTSTGSHPSSMPEPSCRVTATTAPPKRV